MTIQKLTLCTFLCGLLLMQNMHAQDMRSQDMRSQVTSITAMNEEQQKACGIEKLTPEEKQALDSWFVKQIPPPVAPAPAPQIKKGKIQHGEFAVAANVNLGRFITLENGLTYDIPSRSRKKTMSWKVGDKVSLVEPIKPVNYKLENLAQKQTIGAKIATTKKAPKETKPE